MTMPVISTTAAADPGAARSGPRGRRRRLRFVANPKASTGLAILGIYLLVAVVGPWVAPYDPDQRSKDLLEGPSAHHWFGTTHLGQDIFSQVLVGTRGVMFVGLLAGVVASILSVAVGVTSGYV